MPREPFATGSAAFTLVELLAVMGIMVLLLGLIVPVVGAIKGNRDVVKAAYDISGTLENARTYAIANNTYVWVGFFEEDGSKSSANPATAGKGRVVIFVVASKDGTRYSDSKIDGSTPAAFGTEAAGTTPQTNQVKLTPLLNLIKLDGIELDGVNNGQAAVAGGTPTPDTNIPVRPAVPADFQVGDPDSAAHIPAGKGTFVNHTGTNGSPNPTYFTYPLTVNGAAASAQYKFVKIIEFNPQGEASKMEENTFTGLGPQNEMEIALKPTHGNVVDAAYNGTNASKAAVAIQIEGLTGQVRMYRP